MGEDRTSRQEVKWATSESQQVVGDTSSKDPIREKAPGAEVMTMPKLYEKMVTHNLREQVVEIEKTREPHKHTEPDNAVSVVSKAWKSTQEQQEPKEPIEVKETAERQWATYAVCNHLVPAANYCDHCGKMLTHACTRCGRELEVEDRYCDSCGYLVELL